jgi:hypothetical protein
MTDEVIVVLASRGDAAAAALAARHADAGVRVMGPDDLSQEGWVFHLDDPARGTAVLNGRPLPAAAIAGVVTRLPAVTEHDLPHIAQPDRGYVAAEMNAFLLAWLTSLDCPVINRPTPECLSGPHWRQERWVVAAQRLGIPVQPVYRKANAAAAVDPEPGHTVTIVGTQHFGAVDDVLMQRAHALADAAGAELLTVAFDGRHRDARFVGAGLWPDLGDARIADAVVALVRDQHRSPGRLRTVQ